VARPFGVGHPLKNGDINAVFGHDLLGRVFNTAPVCLKPRPHCLDLLGRVSNTANGPKLGSLLHKNGDLPMGTSLYVGRSSH